jgi:hypothetical protein
VQETEESPLVEAVARKWLLETAVDEGYASLSVNCKV